MADQNTFDRRRFFQRLRPHASNPRQLDDASLHRHVDRLPSDDPAVVRPLVVDWRSDVAASWEDGALEVYTQAGAVFRWDLSAAEIAFLRCINGQRSVGSLYDAAAVERPAAGDGLAARITLLTTLFDAGVLRVVRAEPAPAGSD
jgi:hypothetical protein